MRLSSEQQKRREALLISLDNFMTQTVEADVQRGAATAAQQVEDKAATTTQNNLKRTVTPKFFSDLKVETKKAIREAACEKVLDQLAPEQRERADISRLCGRGVERPL